MSDDYLWDGSGEPDPEVERLEQLLNKYRHQPRPLNLPVRTSRAVPPRLAAAAALIVVAMAALAVYVVQQRSHRQAARAVAGADDRVKDADARVEQKQAAKEPPAPAKTARPVEQRLAAHRAIKQNPRRSVGDVRPTVKEKEFDSSAGTLEVSEAFAASIPVVDVKAAGHFERAQVMLRSFRNADAHDDDAPDVSYEKERSRDLLYENIVLRRDAEAKGNLQVEEVLSSLEPFLLDIANLPDRPSTEDVRSIKERIRNREIIATLQVYSSQNIIAINP